MNLYQLLVKNMNTVTSGQELSQELNMTRAGVWKGIKQLRDQGLIIDSLQSQGYQLKSTQHLLNKEHLESLLPNTYIEIHDSLGSTNEYAKGITQQPALIITSHQTDGKGRRGKSFYSPKDKGLYMSYVPSGDYSIEDTGMLTIRSALALQMAISHYFKIETEIKWLNDIYLRDRKLAGILIEGSVELAPLVGLADGIVDIVETGSTLKANGLEVIDWVTDISARLIANTASLKLRKNDIEELQKKLEAVTK